MMAIVNFQFISRILIHLCNRYINGKYMKKIKTFSKDISKNSVGQAFPNLCGKPMLHHLQQCLITVFAGVKLLKRSHANPINSSENEAAKKSIPQPLAEKMLTENSVLPTIVEISGSFCEAGEVFCPIV